MDKIIRNCFEIVIVGAGPAGIGMAAFLKKVGVNFLVIDKGSIGETFKRWPEQMTLLTPSFTTNYFGYPDINSITPDSSPAFSMKKTFPTGIEYAEYLQKVAEVEGVGVSAGYRVLNVEKDAELFQIQTDKGTLYSKILIWAAGEYFYPNDSSFPGASHCEHTSRIKDFFKLKGDDFIIIGGNESGVDAAIHLIKAGKNVTILDKKEMLIDPASDPSKTLSPRSVEALKDLSRQPRVVGNSEVKKVTKKDDQYIIETASENFVSKTRPILATGFKSSLSVVENLFDFNQNGSPILTEKDESVKTKDLYLVGPQVTHENVIFCFIYKFRQRFAIVGEEICRRSGVNCEEVVEHYSQNSMYLNDLSCCDSQCSC